MNNLSKIIIVLVLILAGLRIYDFFNFKQVPEEPVRKDITEQKLPAPKPTDEKLDNKKQDETSKKIYLYFIKTRANGDRYLTPVARNLPENESALEFSVKELLKGPSGVEAAQGLHSAIPNDVKLLGVKETKNSVIIDLSSNFGSGGGSDSIYSRMRQLIKTSLYNTDKSVYLYINGKKADMLGGEGITFSQPLSENSLDE